MTCELREDVSVPMDAALSKRTTCRPVLAKARAMASPMTPDPMTATSICGIVMVNNCYYSLCVCVVFVD